VRAARVAAIRAGLAAKLGDLLQLLNLLGVLLDHVLRELFDGLVLCTLRSPPAEIHFAHVADQ
jgi:hypothetical protein